jgi:Zn-dependent protease
MFTARWRLFRLLGIPVYLDASWLVILALLTGTIRGIYRGEVPGYEPGFYWAMGLATALAFFVCIVLHELGHAVVGRAGGMPIRGITLFLFGGVAELGAEPASAGKEFRMAVAGPAVSAVLGGVCWLVWRWGAEAGGDPAWLLFFHYLALINFAVLVFNLVPAFPLDGGRVLRSILWGTTGNLRRATRQAATVGQAFAWVLIAWGVLHFFAGDFFTGLWLGLIGLFLNNAARGGYQQLLVREALQGEPVSRFMNPHPIVVPPTLDLRHWVEDYVYRFHRKAFPVAGDGRVEGVVTTQALAKFPREEWDRHAVGEAMDRDVGAYSIAPSADALEALGKMQRTGSSRLLVTEGDRLVGIISLKDLLRFLELKIELEQQDAGPARG